MSWTKRHYRQGSTSTHYTCDRHQRFPLPPDLTLTKPWAGGIRADLVLSTHGRKDTLTGLRRAVLPATAKVSGAAVYTGDVLTEGRRRLLVAVLVAGEDMPLLIAVHTRMPRQRTRAVLRAVNELRTLYRETRATDADAG